MGRSRAAVALGILFGHWLDQLPPIDPLPKTPGVGGVKCSLPPT